jgi:hypothetical protein
MGLIEMYGLRSNENQSSKYHFLNHVSKIRYVANSDLVYITIFTDSKLKFSNRNADCQKLPTWCTDQVLLIFIFRWVYFLHSSQENASRQLQRSGQMYRDRCAWSIVDSASWWMIESIDDNLLRKTS